MRSFSRTCGAAHVGVDAQLVDVQVSLAGGQEGGDATFRIVGLPDSALREGRERIRAAVHHGGWPWPFVPVTVNLAPAAARKCGAALDLPIAVGVLAANGRLPVRDLRRTLLMGELGLDGSLRPVRGVLAAAEAARAAGCERAFVAPGNADEAAAVGALVVHAAPDLRAVVDHLAGEVELAGHDAPAWSADVDTAALDAVRGQPFAVRAAWVAAAGGHNLLLTGPPGCGKTLLARALPALMPALTRDEALTVSRIHSIAGLLQAGLLRRRPFRAPHHTASNAGLLGGGRPPGPGEVSLAHGGVLFLDELPEFARGTLEALRQPIEDGHLLVSRASGSVRLPAQVLLVAAANPCPCGWFGVTNRCRCTRIARERYAQRMSGPLRDRFDLRVMLRPVDPERLVGAPEPRPYAGDAVQAACARQAARARARGDAHAWNAHLPSAVLPEAAAPTAQAEAHLVRFARARRMSGRGVHRVLRVARTLADLADRDAVEVEDIDLALSLRAG